MDPELIASIALLILVAGCNLDFTVTEVGIDEQSQLELIPTGSRNTPESVLNLKTPSS